ncbi:MAG UNVERIFIED_CONTAM: hypothetical protein LVR18_42425 [Planctomycetaceae bacterium]
MTAGHLLTAAEQKRYEQASTDLANAESWSAADDLEELMLEMQSPDVKSCLAVCGHEGPPVFAGCGDDSASGCAAAGRADGPSGHRTRLSGCRGF